MLPVGAFRIVYRPSMFVVATAIVPMTMMRASPSGWPLACSVTRPEITACCAIARAGTPRHSTVESRAERNDRLALCVRVTVMILPPGGTCTWNHMRWQGALQRACVEHGAAQCGICTPGMVMAADRFLRSGLPATDDNVREAIAGNL